MRTLTARVSKLSHRIYATLPWGYRFADFLVKLSLDTAETLGRVMHKVFTEGGVLDLPDNERAYARVFGPKIWKIALAKLRNPEVVEEAASKLLVRWSKKNPIRKEVSRASAENFAITSLINAGLDVIKSRKRRREDLIPVDEKGITMDLRDPRAWDSLENMLTDSNWSAIRSSISRINPKAWDLIELRMAGYTDAEIAVEWGMSKQAVSQFQRKWLPKVKAIMIPYLRIAV